LRRVKERVSPEESTVVTEIEPSPRTGQSMPETDPRSSLRVRVEKSEWTEEK
jgi:hypothetical protein